MLALVPSAGTGPAAAAALAVTLPSSRETALLFRVAATDPDAAAALVLALARRTAGGERQAQAQTHAQVWAFGLQRSRARLVVAVHAVRVEPRVPPRWIRHTLAVDKKVARTVALNAVISTLGGGHFLCRHVDKAMLLAQMQLRNALDAGDAALAGQCRIHMCYIMIQVGRLGVAKRMLRAELRLAHRIASEHLANVARAGLVYLGKVHAHRLELAKPAQGDRLADSFYRQRFVPS